MERKDILSLCFDELSQVIEGMGEKKFRAKQIFSWLHCKKVSDFSQMTDISLSLRTKLEEEYCINSLKIVRRLESKRDNTLKYLCELEDGNHIECVLMEYHHGNSICISTQVGCKMGCTFCASTIAGYRRDLTAGEMLSQVYRIEDNSHRHIDSIVLMGIGEPLDNFDNTCRFLDNISDARGRGMSLRHVSVSTCGIVPRIQELAEKKYGITLSVSLHCPDNEGRSRIMPVNRRYDVDELMKACREYTDATGRRISFEYAVMNGVNDSREDAKKLYGLLKGFMCHVNLIPVNEVKETEYTADRHSVEVFAKMLSDYGLNVTVRRTLGADIDAACGQLRREYEI
ncbi:MAG: 23S rRNA (adenine(2503)-C(2))-methyltransferase RlmN [Oscillospiraceae bacterium]|nr:23S rRNA (adenine(2503)-C(2))-methyltransferase RlmN [Oscillospiraceae bacterium]